MRMCGNIRVDVYHGFFQRNIDMMMALKDLKAHLGKQSSLYSIYSEGNKYGMHQKYISNEVIKMKFSPDFRINSRNPEI